MIKYIQFDKETKNIFGISDLLERIEPLPDDMVEITDEQYSHELIGKLWNGKEIVE